MGLFFAINTSGLVGRGMSLAHSGQSSGASRLKGLLGSPVRPGTVTWIGLRPVRRVPLTEVSSAVLIAGRGIEGDHFKSRNNGARQVTLIAAEDLAAVASFLGLEKVDPQSTRRNVVTSGINLVALKGKRFSIGDTVLATSGECAPCGFMQETLGPGGFNAMRGRGGITARIITGGTIRIGDAVTVLADETQDAS